LEDTLIIQEFLKSNFTIHGIHYEGNEGRINSLGFLIPKDFKELQPSKIGDDDTLLCDPGEHGVKPTIDGTSTRIRNNKSPILT
jgi:hypothetical protein